MDIKERSRRPRKKTLSLNNQALLAMVGVLSVVLVVLLIVCGSLMRQDTSNPSDTQLGSQGTTNGAESQGTNPSESVVAPVPSQPTTSSTPTTTTTPTTPTTTTVPTTAPTKPVTPTGGNYVNVGSGYIVEVIRTNVETFDGDTTDDYSHPTNNYLPEGTVDYCDRDLVWRGETSYVLMRSGHRTYVEKKVYPFDKEPITRKIAEVKRYEGTLPDHNEIGIASFSVSGHHTVLTLDSLWKAPFYFDIAPQKYANPDGGSNRSYSITSVTATYVDITFCYATVFNGKLTIPTSNPLFKSAEIIKNESDYTLRLHLRKTGGFYGWHAYYNEKNQLCFQFLNPVKVTKADNAYGANLKGAIVMIDVGHGGTDGGAVGKDATGQKWEEADLNLLLAETLKKELESIGATVLMNRSDDSSININARLDDLVAKSPDICVAIHQNSYSTDEVTGFDAMYFTPYSKLLAQKIAEHTKETGVYSKSRFSWSVNYFMMRQTVCPTILTENGYMSNPEELGKMSNAQTVLLKAQAMTRGIVDHFLAIK